MSTKMIAGGVGVAVAVALCFALFRGCASTSSSRPPAPGAALAPAPMDAAARALPAALENPIPSDAPQSPPEEVRFPSGPYKLRGALLRPEGPGPSPALVYNHGSESDPSLDYMGELARWFQKRGFVVLFPFRRGASGSEGQHWETLVEARPEAERDRATVEQLDAQSDDVLAGIAFLQTQPYVDRAFVAVAGCSFGGIETVLTAERSPDVYAAVDFAGASFTWSKSAPLRERLIAAVRNARVPTFFIQAENDFDTTPSLVLSDELAKAGKPGDRKIFPPHGRTVMAGHAHFCNHGMNEWGEDVLAFLRDAAHHVAR